MGAIARRAQGGAGGLASGIARASDSNRQTNARWVEDSRVPEHDGYARTPAGKDPHAIAEHHPINERRAQA